MPYGRKDGVEVEVDGPAAADVGLKAADGGLPTLRHGRAVARVIQA